MGLINSKSSKNNNYSNIFHLKNSNDFPSSSHPQSFLSLCTHQNHPNNIHHFDNKRRLCLKKKVLLLGLDGVGKTDLFTRLISHYKQGLKIKSLPRPTTGKFICVYMS